jgi:hypothetical protein
MTNEKFQMIYGKFLADFPFIISHLSFAIETLPVCPLRTAHCPLPSATMRNDASLPDSDPS